MRLCIPGLVQALVVPKIHKGGGAKVGWALS